jgi:hypothetical protein
MTSEARTKESATPISFFGLHLLVDKPKGVLWGEVSITQSLNRYTHNMSGKVTQTMQVISPCKTYKFKTSSHSQTNIYE